MTMRSELIDAAKLVATATAWKTVDDRKVEVNASEWDAARLSAREILRLNVIPMPVSGDGMIDIQQFCDEDGLSELKQPYISEGFEYATDGRICVRRPSSAPNTIPLRRSLSEAHQFFQSNASYSPIGAMEYVGDCESCVGGESECECCGRTETCCRCAGTDNEKSWLGRYAVGIRYDKMIRSLPDVQVAMDTDRKTVRFRSGDLEGVLMPLCVDGNTKVVDEREISVLSNER